VKDHFPPSALKSLQESMSGNRFTHSKNVFETALHIGRAWSQFDIDLDALAWASLFHDCAKEVSKEDRKKWLAKEKIAYGLELIEQKKLIHAPLGAHILQVRYGIQDPDVLMAVAYHPTGHPDLSVMGWIVYAADYLEPGRSFLENREHIFDTICDNPLDGLREITQLRIKMVKAKGKSVHPLALKVQKYLQNSAEKLFFGAPTASLSP
jgi:predicted HD superfamily hydrolase involved in NAD metabolism